MYIVTNLSATPPTQSECDAIETVIYNKKKKAYIPSENPDGFKAFVIEHISPTEEICVVTVYAFEGHTLSGNEPFGEYEWRDDTEETK